MIKARANTDPTADLYHEVQVKLGYSDEVSNETYLGLSQEDFDLTPYRRYAASQRARMNWHRLQAQLTYAMAGDGFDVRLTGYRHDFARTWVKLNQFRGGKLFDVLMRRERTTEDLYAVLTGQQDSLDTSGRDQLVLGSNARNYVSQGIQAFASWRPDLGELSQTIELGARLHYDQIVRDHTFVHQEVLRSTLVPKGDEGQEKSNVGSALAWSFHLKDELAWRGLTAAPIVRLEIIDTEFIDRKRGAEPGNAAMPPNPAVRQQIAVSPGLGLQYQIVDELAVLAGVHRGFSPVSPGQGDQIQPEESIAYEFGLDMAYERTSALLVGFFNDYANITGECTGSNGCGSDLVGDQFNGGTAYVYGLEASLSQSVALPYDITLSAEVDYTLTLSEFLTEFSSQLPAFESVVIGDELAYVPVHSGSVAVRAFGPSWGVDVLVRHVGQMRDIPGQGPVAPQERILDHTVVDLSGSWSPFEGAQIYAKIENLFDTAYMISRRPYGARPGRPFHFMLGFKYRFADPKFEL